MEPADHGKSWRKKTVAVGEAGHTYQGLNQAAAPRSEKMETLKTIGERELIGLCNRLDVGAERFQT